MNRRKFVQTTGLLTAAVFLNLNLTAQAAENEIILDLNPDKTNPRNSEGSFVTLKSGRILFFYTRFHGGSADDSPANIVSIFSDDSGKTWSKEPQVVVENPTGANVMSVSLLRLQSGKIALFYLVKNSLIDCRPVIRISTDEAQTWSDAKHAGDAPGYFVLNNDRVIQLKSGRLVMPVAFHRSRASLPKNHRSLDSRGIALWYLSDDEGATWREADDWFGLPAHTRSGFQEPGVVELPNGNLLGWMRTDQGAQFFSHSNDGGKSWSPPEKSPLQSPESPTSIKRIPGTEKLLAIFNDHSGKFPFVKNKRTPLVAAVSIDGGKTWPERKLIESDPNGWYCYTAIHFVGDAILLGYCAGDPKIGGLNRLRLRRLELNWLNDAK
jgi:Neuraminidase (sialidase)